MSIERRVKGVASVAVLALASVAFALGAAELAVRVLHPTGAAEAADRSGASPRKHAVEEEAEGGGRGFSRSGSATHSLPEFTTVAELVEPNARGTFQGALYRTNSAGLRGPEYSREPEPGVFRIAVSGDSYTMGWGVEEHEAYPARLEDLLNAAGDGYRYEVLNLGVATFNLRYNFMRLVQTGLRYNPDLIVFGYTLNDIEGRRFVRTFTREERERRVQLYLSFQRSPFHLIRLLGPRIVTLWEVTVQPQGTMTRELTYNYNENPAAWAVVESGLDRLAALRDRTGICIHMLIHTRAVQLNWLHPFADIYRKVAKAARSRGLTVTETFDAHRGRRTSELRLGMSDPHPSPAGHDLLARELFQGLRRLPQRCWIPRRLGQE